MLKSTALPELSHLQIPRSAWIESYPEALICQNSVILETTLCSNWVMLKGPALPNVSHTQRHYFAKILLSSNAILCLNWVIFRGPALPKLSHTYKQGFAKVISSSVAPLCLNRRVMFKVHVLSKLSHIQKHQFAKVLSFSRAVLCTGKAGLLQMDQLRQNGAFEDESIVEKRSIWVWL